MIDLKSYLYSLILASIVCVIVKKLLSGNATISSIARILCGIFLVCTFLQPLERITLPEWEDLQLQSDAQVAVAQGVNSAHEALSSCISQQVESYILGKAAQLEASVSVQVRLSDDTIPVPMQVRISGSISPYGKQQLQAIIEQDLGIPKEDQIWSDR